MFKECVINEEGKRGKKANGISTKKGKTHFLLRGLVDGGGRPAISS